MLFYFCLSLSAISLFFLVKFAFESLFDKKPKATVYEFNAEQYKIDKQLTWNAWVQEYKNTRSELTKANKSNRRLNKQNASLRLALKQWHKEKEHFSQLQKAYDEWIEQKQQEKQVKKTRTKKV